MEASAPLLLLLLLLWMMLHLALSSDPPLSPKGLNYEVAALMAVKSWMRDEKGVTDGWDINSVDPCTWSMVCCSSDGFVISLEMANNGLSGSLSPSIGNLSHLQALWKLKEWKNAFVCTLLCRCVMTVVIVENIFDKGFYSPVPYYECWLIFFVFLYPMSTSVDLIWGLLVRMRTLFSRDRAECASALQFGIYNFI
ncbi:putative non-specific serine/threonine protein kinase [Dioscorea sansibarensis]